MEEFVKAEDCTQTNAQVGQAVLEFILKRERLLRGVVHGGYKQDTVDKQTLEALNDPSALTHQHSIAEAVFRRLVADPGQAIGYLAEAIQDRTKAQSDRAKRPRKNRRDSITQLIHDTLEDFPLASAKEVFRKLEESKVLTETDGEIRNTVDNCTMRSTSWPSRVSAAKKRNLASKNGDSG